MRFDAKWIGASRETGDVCPVFRKTIILDRSVRKARLIVTALGVYSAEINHTEISYRMAPGWTAYDSRLQYQSYDVTPYLKAENEILVTLGKGWYASPMPGWLDSADKRRRMSRRRGILAQLQIDYADGGSEIIGTDESWSWCEGRTRFSEIYDGEIYDASLPLENWQRTVVFSGPDETLIPQEGERIVEAERIRPKEILHTPAGETVVDFGQEITGYAEFELEAHVGQKVSILHGEVLDGNGCFYNDNYRSAKAEVVYTCREGKQRWHPCLTFFGFRYLLIREFPKKPELSDFAAIVVHSEMERTGFVESGHRKLNQLVSNIIWSQRGNFLDVPTDCPQRDERLGWTGDVQVFAKAASYNYDVERFLRKWLRDLAADQRENGAVGQVIPDYMPEGEPSSAWGDVAVICPWQLYQTYGNREVLQEQFESMRRWVDYITHSTEEEGLWVGGFHFGDWLGLDAEPGSYRGASRESFIASAFYYRSSSLLVKTGELIGRDVSFYRDLAGRIRTKFNERFPSCLTQTEHVLAVMFGLTDSPQEVTKQLADMIVREGTSMKTGFVGTPYLLHVLTDYGYAKLAYDLLLREQYPSWLYAVGKGATTVWEHWDGIMEDGTFWSTDMNSFNHYAYGSVIDWIYEKAAGIQHPEECAGFTKAVIMPHPDKRLGFLNVSLKTRSGMIRSCWNYTGGGVRFEIETHVPAQIIIDGKEYSEAPGSYVFWGKE